MATRGGGVISLRGSQSIRVTCISCLLASLYLGRPSGNQLSLNVILVGLAGGLTTAAMMVALIFYVGKEQKCAGVSSKAFLQLKVKWYEATSCGRKQKERREKRDYSRNNSKAIIVLSTSYESQSARSSKSTIQIPSLIYEDPPEIIAGSVCRPDKLYEDEGDFRAGVKESCLSPSIPMTRDWLHTPTSEADNPDRYNYGNEDDLCFSHKSMSMNYASGNEGMFLDE